jgi:hypothetical protein
MAIDAGCCGPFHHAAGYALAAQRTTGRQRALPVDCSAHRHAIYHVGNGYPCDGSEQKTNKEGNQNAHRQMSIAGKGRGLSWLHGLSHSD